MKHLATSACLFFLMAIPPGCSPAERYDFLSVIFDGVPPPDVADVSNGNHGGRASGTGLLTGESRRSVAGTHGPFGARMCGACHESIDRNTLVAPRETLCFRCHDLKLDKAYVHGPLASGGCTVCHDPHQSRYRYLLVAESGTFCLHCHDKDAIAHVEAHDAADLPCTSCHDAHQSNKRYLLK